MTTDDDARSPEVDAYLAGFGEPVRSRLAELRALVHAAVPGMTERISYRIPTFDLGGKYVVYVSGAAGHVSMHPATDDNLGELAAEAAPYRHGKGTLRFALDEPLPADLVRRFTQARALTRGWTPGA